VKFSNGYELQNVPYLNGYYARRGDPLAVGNPNDKSIKITVSYVDTLWDTAGLADGDTATVTLAEAGAFKDVQELFSAKESDERFDPQNAAIGVSMPVVGIERAPIAMRQAEFACTSESDSNVRYCKDLALPFLLRSLREEPSTQDMLHPAISIITHYDANHNTRLMDILHAYLDARYNQVEAAKSLHVHLNTFKYRLKRIEEVADLDFRNKADMLYLQLSFELQ